MIQLKKYICSVADCCKPGLGRCSQCKVRYCGEDCQADDWPSHMRFCFPLPPLEYPEDNQAWPGWSESTGQVIDINSSTNSDDVISDTVSLELTTTKKDDVTDGDGKVKKKKEEENNNIPGHVKEAAKVPEDAVASLPIPEVGDSSPKPKEVVEVMDTSSAKQVKPAISSTQMATQGVSGGLQDIDHLPATQIVSPAEFSISLAAEVNFRLIFPSISPFILVQAPHYLQLVSLMNDKPPAADSSWTVGREEPVSALHEDCWQRGLAIKKKGQDYEVFIIDAGQSVTISQENMRSLPSELRQVPPFIYQVGSWFSLQ